MPPALEAWSLNHWTALQVPLPFALNALSQIHTYWFLFITEHSVQMAGALHKHKVVGPLPLHPCLLHQLLLCSSFIHSQKSSCLLVSCLAHELRWSKVLAVFSLLCSVNLE